MLSKRFVETLEGRFNGQTVQLHAGPQPFVSFAPIHPTWSTIEVCDDDDELTIYFGGFTHVHFGNYDEALSIEQRGEEIVRKSMLFLDDVLADKIEFYTTRFGGGCRPVGSQGKWSRAIFGTQKAFVWSGPVKPGSTGMHRF